MLGLLHIENIAVISSVDVDFGSGFNALTGETGAGKSIIIDSIGALLGERTSRDLIRTGARMATVSGWFTGVGTNVTDILAKAEISVSDGTVSVERRMYADGRNICRINGAPASVTLLKEVGPLLISIHGQHDSRLLLDPDIHICMLDAFTDVAELSEKYKTELAKLKHIRSCQKALLTDSCEIERRREMLTFQIQELSAAGLHAGELAALEQKRSLVQNAAKIANALTCAMGELQSDGDSISGRIGAAAGFVRAVGESLGPELSNAAVLLEEAAASVRSAALTVEDSLSAVGFSEKEADEVEDRTALLRGICKKYGGSEEAAIAWLSNAEEERAALENNEEAACRLEADYRAQYAVTLSAATALSEARQLAAGALEQAVNGELEYLCMPGARFQVRISRKTRDDRVIFGKDGIDVVEFYLAANRGEDYRPLARCASGGELSRIMLALCVAGGRDSAGTVIFDEIDTGISGIAASRVADRLARLSLSRQVLCVTHLSQLAAAADFHFLLQKKTEDGRTTTTVSELDREMRISELVRINSGEAGSEASRAAAAVQLDMAAETKKKSVAPENTAG